MIAKLPDAHLDVLAVLNGVAGHDLDDRGSGLAIRMALGEPDVEPTSRICVFVHGLMATNRWWRFAEEPSEWYGSRLYRDLGFTPLQIFYNSGRPIASNGRALAELLEQLGTSYPRPIEEIAFVAHSMGGLVVHSAIGHGSRERQSWVGCVRRMALLGVPHVGSPLAQLGDIAERALDLVPHPVARALARIADRRSDGLKNLRAGLQPDAAALPGVDYYVGAATLGDPTSRFPRLVGDVLVPTHSAGATTLTGRRVLAVSPRAFHIFGRTSHLGLMRNPAVADKLAEWFSTRETEIGPAVGVR